MSIMDRLRSAFADPSADPRTDYASTDRSVDPFAPVGSMISNRAAEVSDKAGKPRGDATLHMRQKTMLGMTYRDKVSGFEGIAMAKIQYLTGCDQTCLHPSENKDGKPAEGVWFDDMRLELVVNGRKITLSGVVLTDRDPNYPVPVEGGGGAYKTGADFDPPGGTQGRSKPPAR